MNAPVWWDWNNRKRLWKRCTESTSVWLLRRRVANVHIFRHRTFDLWPVTLAHTLTKWYNYILLKLTREMCCQLSSLGISFDFFTISKQLLIFQTNIRSANLFCIRTSRSELGAARMHQCVHSHTHAAHAICLSTLWRRSVLSNGHSRTKVKYCTRVAGEQQTSWLCHETDWSPPQSCCVTSSELAHF